MKRIGKILSMAVVIVMTAGMLSFASGLALVESYPEDGAKGFEPINMMVKLEFSGNVGDELVQATNEKAFNMVDGEGNKVKFKVLFSEDEPNKIMLLMDGDLASDTEYTVTIKNTLASGDGELLPAEQAIKFYTRDVKKDTLVSTVMMFVMVGGMIMYQMWDTKRKVQKEAMAKGEKVNPYKVAKEKGVSVEKAVEKTAKEREKAVKKSGGSNMKVRKGSEIKGSGKNKKK